MTSSPKYVNNKCVNKVVFRDFKLQVGFISEKLELTSVVFLCFEPYARSELEFEFKQRVGALQAEIETLVMETIYLALIPLHALSFQLLTNNC